MLRDHRVDQTLFPILELVEAEIYHRILPVTVNGVRFKIIAFPRVQLWIS